MQTLRDIRNNFDQKTRIFEGGFAVRCSYDIVGKSSPKEPLKVSAFGGPPKAKWSKLSEVKT